MQKFNPGKETHADYLRRMAKQVGHFAFARWAERKGYSFRFTHHILFNTFPRMK
jgi:hypothetical protein